MLNITTRALNRRRIRKLPVAERPEARPQPVRMIADGGYMTLTPTGGWKRFCGKRIIAGHMLSHIHETAAARAMGRKMARAAVQPKTWGEPAAVPAPTVTRQQKRFAKRHGLPIPGEAVKPKTVRKPRAKKAVA